LLQQIVCAGGVLTRTVVAALCEACLDQLARRRGFVTGASSFMAENSFSVVASKTTQISANGQCVELRVPFTLLPTLASSVCPTVGALVATASDRRPRAI